MIFDTAGLSSGDDCPAPTKFLRNRVGVQLKIAKSSTEESLRGKRRGSALSHPHVIPHRRLAMPQLDGVRVRVFKERTVYNMQNRGEDTLTARQKAFSSSNGKATETNLAGEKVVKRPVSVVVGVILTCIMPILYSVVTLFLCVQMKASGEASALLILSLAMHAVTVIASIGVFHRMANARFVIAIMYLIALFGMRESPFIFLLPFLIPAIGLMLMFSPRANKWLRRR